MPNVRRAAHRPSGLSRRALRLTPTPLPAALADLAEDLDIFDWKLSAAEMAKLDAATTPTGKPSFACDAVVEQA